MVSYSKMTIYFDFTRYAFPVYHYETILFGNCMLGVLLVTSDEEKNYRCCREFILLVKPKTRCCEANWAILHLQLTKQQKQNTGLYMPQPVPDRPWQDVRMDFVLGLLKTVRKHDFIFVVMDHFQRLPTFYNAARLLMLSKFLRFILTE